MAKGLKLKVRKFWGLIPTFAEVAEENLVGGGRGGFLPPPAILNMFNCDESMLGMDRNTGKVVVSRKLSLL